MKQLKWDLIAVAQAMLGILGLLTAASLSEGDDALVAWYGFGPAWMLMAAYSWRHKPGRMRDAPVVETIVLVGGALTLGAGGVVLAL